MKHTFENLFASAGSFEHYQGYRYLYQSVLLVMQDPERLCHIGKEVYQHVAEENKTSLSNVHKDIRTLLSSFWNHGGSKSFVEWTGCVRWNYERPYPKEFIAILAKLLGERKY